MDTPHTYAPAPFWDAYFAAAAAAGTDLNPDGWWAPHFVPYLDRYAVTTLLDLGCGTGADSLFLARRGLQVSGLDYSRVALRRARQSARRLPHGGLPSRRHGPAAPLRGRHLRGGHEQCRAPLLR